MARQWVGWSVVLGICAVVLTASAQVDSQQRRGAGPGDMRPPVMRQGGPRGPVGPGGGDPAVDKALARLMAARALVRLELTAEELGKVIGPLRQVARRDATFADEVVKLVEAEEKEVLGLRPGARFEDGPPESVRRAQYDHRQALEHAWEGVVQAIGPHRAMGLRGLVEPQMPGRMGPMPGDMQGMPGVEGMPGMSPGPGMPAPPPGAMLPGPGGGPFGPEGGGPQGMAPNPGMPMGQAFPGDIGPRMMHPMMGRPPSVSLTELLDLLTRRLAALKG